MAKTANRRKTKPKFVHLRVHSEFSIKTGLMKVKQIIELANKNRMPGVCVSDLNMLCGLIKLYENAKGQSVKPICALDMLLKDDNGVISEITLYAKNNEGYLNICRLLTKAYVRTRPPEVSKTAKPLARGENVVRETRVLTNFADLREHSEGVVCLLASYNGIVGQYIRKDKYEEVFPIYQTLKEIYGNYLFQAIARCNRPHEHELESYIISVANKFELPLVAVNDVLFAKREDFFTHQLRVCIGQSKFMSDYAPDYTEEQYYKSTDEMIQLFKDLPKAIINTELLTKLCTVSIKLGHHDLPRFHLDPENPTDTELYKKFQVYKQDHPEADEEEWILETLAIEGLDERLKVLYPDPEEYKRQYPIYRQRLDYEIDIIKNMKFPGYFLIVQEFINWSKNKGIPVGPGRGSGAGSLVAYCLRITDLDPLKYALLFERFLNPARKSMPDFDVDFCNEGRSTVIKHMQDHYGKDSVSQIMTFGTMGAKLVVRDVARALGLDNKKADRLAKVIQDKIEIVKRDENGEEFTQTLKGNLANNIAHNSQFKGLYNENDPDYKQIVDYSLALEGLVRQVGKHAAGIVISPGEMAQYSALYLSDDGEQSTHYDKDDVERAGLVKFDFLGLKNLTIINNTMKMLTKKYKNCNQEMFDLSQIPLDDEATYKLLQRGDTHGVFQLESAGITKLVVKAEPKTFEDIIAIIALYRPGPLQSGMVDNYINRKKGTEEVFYPTQELSDDCLKEVLDPTYGVIVYQEQVMQIAQVFSGYTLGDADNLRRAMGKKKAEVMAAERSKFVEGAVKLGRSAEKASQLFDLVDKFAGYGFNKSHSAAYALISYQTAYLKAHHRAEFLAAVLTNAQSDIGKIYGTIKDLNKNGDDDIEYLPPEVNRSYQKFVVNGNNNLLYSLAALKGIGEEAAAQVVRIRARGGKYTSLYDFINRNLDNLSETQFRTLNYAGAFDKFIEENKDKRHSREAYDAVIKQIITACKTTRQADLFVDDTANMDNYVTPELVNKLQPWTIKENLKHQYDSFNFYFAGHPILEYAPERKALADVESLGKLEELFEEFKVTAQAAYERNSRPPTTEYNIVAKLDFIKKSTNFSGFSVLDIEFSDETSMFKGNYNIDDQNQRQILSDKLENDGVVYVRIRFGSYVNKESGTRFFTRKIVKIAPLQDVIDQSNLRVKLIVDIRSPEKLDKYYKIKQKISEFKTAPSYQNPNAYNHQMNQPDPYNQGSYPPNNQAYQYNNQGYPQNQQDPQNLEPSQEISLCYYTELGVVRLPNCGIPIKLKRELMTFLKDTCGVGWIRMEVENSKRDVFKINYKDFRY